MDQNLEKSLDHEYGQFLEIMRPHICQLKDQRMVSLCSAWIQRLCGCKDHEKILRNKYIVTLCYQLSKGILEEPFVNEPMDKELLPINEPTFSEVSSSEVECLALDSDAVKLHSNKSSTSETADSTDYKIDSENKNAGLSDKNKTEFNKDSPYQRIIYKHRHPEANKCSPRDNCTESYRFRTNNIIFKLKEMKQQNTLLHHELKEMKERSSEEGCIDECNNAGNTSTLYMRLHESNSTLDSLKSRLKEVQGVRNALIHKIQSMQEFIDNLNELKSREIEEIYAKHKLQLTSIKSCIKEEMKQIFDHKLEQQKLQYEEKIKEIQSISVAKDNIISEKEKIIQQKELEISHLSNQIKGSKENIHSVLKKLIDKRNEAQRDDFKIKNHILEKRIIKMEKAKIRCIRAYESKLSCLQRERHLLECSLQIQLVRQRAQVINDLAGDCHSETKRAVDKLETKYQDMVANMQATAIQRRLEDQMAVASILQAASGLRNDSYGFFSPSFPKVPINLKRNKNLLSECEVPIGFEGNKVFSKVIVNKNFKDENECFGERRTLFEKVPQRDSNDKAQK